MPQTQSVTEDTVEDDTVARRRSLSAIRERNRTERKRASAIARTIESLDVFGVKAIAAHISGVALHPSIIKQQAEEIVDAVLGLTREPVN